MSDTPRGSHIAALHRAIDASQRAAAAAQEEAARIAAEREEDAIRRTNLAALATPQDTA